MDPRSRASGCALAVLVALAGSACTAPAAAARPPNIVFIMADDLGWGDLSCQGATKLRTPSIDRIATGGIRLTDAHTPSGVCCPTRYGVLTGRYPWRRSQTCWATPGAALLIEEGRETTASVLRKAGYATGVVGKWHLGFGTRAKPVDWNADLVPGPLDVGFDYFFGDVGNRWGAYVENRRIVCLDPAHPIPARPGNRVRHPAFSMVNAENAGVLTAKAVAFIERCAAAPAKPFYLHYVPNNVHTPHTPNARFKGGSQCGPYGDFVQELDGSVGEILDVLDRLGLATNTLVIFTSDNGGGYDRAAVDAGHRCCAPFNGQKGDAWEGGNRVPFLARWQGRIAPGRVSDGLLCLTDMLATFAAVAGQAVPAGAGFDSVNALPLLLGTGPGARTNLVVQSGPSSAFEKNPADLWAVREGTWKLVRGRGAGYSTQPVGDRNPYLRFAQAGMTNSDISADGVPKPDAPPQQLYDLQADPGETRNVFNDHPDVVERLNRLFERLRDAERAGTSASGAGQ